MSCVPLVSTGRSRLWANAEATQATPALVRDFLHVPERGFSGLVRYRYLRLVRLGSGPDTATSLPASSLVMSLFVEPVSPITRNGTTNSTPHALLRPGSRYGCVVSCQATSDRRSICHTPSCRWRPGFFSEDCVDQRCLQIEFGLTGISPAGVGRCNSLCDYRSCGRKVRFDIRQLATYRDSRSADSNKSNCCDQRAQHCASRPSC